MDTRAVIREMRSNRDLIETLSRADFANVIAELLQSFGWDIQPIAHNFAGGVTFLGTSHPILGVESTWIIECFAPDAGEITPFTFEALARATTFMPGANALLITLAEVNRDATQSLQDTTNVQVVGRSTLDRWIEAYEPKPVPSPPKFRSCFISYSQHDLDFASELYARLRQSGVRVWFAPEDLLPGDHVYPQVRAAIAGVDKLIIVLSEQSIESSWVRAELRNAHQREVAEKQRLLLPIRLVGLDKLRYWEWFETDLGRDLASAVRDYYIPDFSGWRDPSTFARGFDQLLRALRY